MAQAEFVGMMVICLSIIVGLFLQFSKPFNKNTEAMTALTIKMEQLTITIKEEKEDRKQDKLNVRDNQKRQWIKIDLLNEKLIEQNAEIGFIKQSLEKMEKERKESEDEN